MAKVRKSKAQIMADYQAEDDAYILLRAVEINDDKKRVSKAKKAAKDMAKRRLKEAEAALKAAEKLSTKSKGKQKK